jgi:two-component system, OmpR family, sensor kinase
VTTQPKGKLNRQELGWLLTQEAQGAAERLRKGVQVLLTNIPPPPVAGEPGVDQTLDALDDAMKMLSSIHHKPVGGRGRRGRIDLASLLWEVAPEARVSLEPGSGTEVFGEEAELRRMLHVLVGAGSSAGSAVTLKRHGEEVRLAVTLGPDSSVTSDTERAWLSRMAIRYGGRYELEGGSEIMTLPADGSSERQEREALRKELDEARKQGEAYARELAAIFGQSDETSMTPSSFPPMATPALDKFGVLTRVAGGIAAELRGMLSPVGWDLLALRASSTSSESASTPQSIDTHTPLDIEGADDRLEAIQRRLVRVQDFIAELASMGELDASESSTDVDLVEMARLAVRLAKPRADRSGVELSLVTVPDTTETRAPTRAAPRAIATLLRELISHALAATPRGKQVIVTVTAAPVTSSFGARISVDDGGASLPATARRSFLNLELVPGTYGRPTSLALYFCQSIAAFQAATLALDESPLGGVRVAVSFTR